MIGPALSSALSGLNAQSLRLKATASNVANVSTGGAVPGSAEAAAGAPVVYRPLRVEMTSGVGADGGGYGVSASITEKQNSFSFSHNPDAPGADAVGMVAVPNVDLATEMVNLLDSKNLFKANAAVIRSASEMSGELLDILS
jgi:flagellar basal-body rod protein FlgC